MRRSPLCAVERQLDTRAGHGEDEAQAATSGWSWEHWASVPCTLELCRVTHTGQSWGDARSAQKEAYRIRDWRPKSHLCHARRLNFSGLQDRG